MMKIPNYVPIINIALGGMTMLTPAAIPSAILNKPLLIIGAVVMIAGVAALATQYFGKRMNFMGGTNLVAGAALICTIGVAQATPGLFWSDLLLGILTFVTGCVSLAYEPPKNIAAIIPEIIPAPIPVPVVADRH